MKVNQCDICKRIIGSNEIYLKFKVEVVHPVDTTPATMGLQSDAIILILDICDECIKKGFKIMTSKIMDPHSYLLLLDK